MTIEQEIVPVQYERKLAYLLRHNKELETAILVWAKELLAETRAEWAEIHASSIENIVFQDRRALAVKRSYARDKKYRAFREIFKNVQRERWIALQRKGEKLTASAFVQYFLKNAVKSVDIPYKKSNLNNKLNQLAQANNREFEKSFC